MSSSDRPPVAHVTEDAIRELAYEISQRPDAGTPDENWRRAVCELQEDQARQRIAAEDTETAIVSPLPPFASATTRP